jgi:hypothetical protein
MRTRYSRSTDPRRAVHRCRASAPPRIQGLPQVTGRHAMNLQVVTDIGKEASIARSGSTDDETKPTFGAQFAPHGRRSPIRAASCCSRVRPAVGPPPLRDFRVAFVSPSDERAIDLRGIWHAGGFHGYRHCVRPTQWRDASMGSRNPENERLGDTLGAQCDCNLHSSRAQFVEGANRVFDGQIDAS